MDYNSMSGAELVAAYNQKMAETGGRQIREFRTREDGIRRLQALSGSGEVPSDPAEAKRQFTREMGGDASETGKAPQGAEVQGGAQTAPVRTKGAKKTKEPKPPRDGIHGEFQTRSGTIRARLLDFLAGSMGKPVPLPTIVKKLYDDPEKKVAALMVMKGIQIMIDKHGAPYELVRTRDPDTKVPQFALSRKEAGE